MSIAVLEGMGLLLASTGSVKYHLVESPDFPAAPGGFASSMKSVTLEEVALRSAGAGRGIFVTPPNIESGSQGFVPLGRPLFEQVRPHEGFEDIARLVREEMNATRALYDEYAAQLPPQADVSQARRQAVEARIRDVAEHPDFVRFIIRNEPI